MYKTSNELWSAFGRIFLPMVKDYSEIKHIHKALNGIEVVPMVETKDGVQNLSAILEQDRARKLIDKIHYGHFDFCLDSKIWPLPDPNHKKYWNIILPIIDILKKHNKIFVNTPFHFPK